MASRTLNVTITGDARSLNRALGSVDSQTGKVEGRLTKFSSIAKGALAGVAVGGTALLVKGLSDSVSAAARAEKSQARLQAQLRASGISYRAHAAEIDKAIQKTSQLSALDDEDLQDAFTNIVRTTGDVSKALRLTGLAADFARAKHLDVAKAGEIVAKVAGGNTGILSRYGITIEKGATATQALGALQQKFAGQAAAYGRTTAGAQERFRVATENLQEAIGKKLTPVLARAFNAAARFITQMQNGTGAGGRFAKAINQIADTMRPWVALTIRAGSVVTSNFDKIAKAISIVTTANRALFRAFQSVADAEVSVGSKAVAAGKAIGGGFASAARSVAGIFREVAGAVQSVINKVNGLLSLIPRIKLPRINLGPLGHVGRVRTVPNPNPGPGLGAQLQFAASDVELAQTDLSLQGTNPLADAHRKAEQRRQKLIGDRLTQIRRRLKLVQKALMKRGLKPPTRRAFIDEELALMQEEASLSAELNSLASDIAGPAPDTGVSADAGASSDVPFDGGGSAADVGAMTSTPDTSAADLAAAIQELAEQQKATREFAERVHDTEKGAISQMLAQVVGTGLGIQVGARGLTPAYGVGRRS